MADSRNCDQCGAPFTPRREHARFCSACCRAAWNRRHAGNPADTSALDWSITAMRDTIARLCRASGWDRTDAGLRFVRNRMGYHARPADFIEPADTGPASLPGPGNRHPSPHSPRSPHAAMTGR
jgi:hypothetical protein